QLKLNFLPLSRRANYGDEARIKTSDEPRFRANHLDRAYHDGTSHSARAAQRLLNEETDEQEIGFLADGRNDCCIGNACDGGGYDQDRFSGDLQRPWRVDRQ